ncbi:BURP domain-containing protein 1-like [Vitis riparia]|uniref:BURP domain-containing protein 1-like n=1 Tax=Vitis riparia TaxID=96939 RepID=UPI00155A7791|nr:BURP domain-containing protein 1-like [Vitis riparia]
MEFLRPLPILAFLSVVVVVSHASLPSEGYWKLVLPHTPMPKAVKDHLYPGVTSFNASAAAFCLGIYYGFNKIPQPFHAKQAQDGLNIVKEKSAEAELMKKEIEDCEEPAMDGESRFCATSLESLIDFSTSKLGRNVNVLTNEVRMGSQEFELE